MLTCVFVIILFIILFAIYNIFEVCIKYLQQHRIISQIIMLYLVVVAISTSYVCNVCYASVKCLQPPLQYEQDQPLRLIFRVARSLPL